MAQYFIWGDALVGLVTDRFRTSTLSVVSQSGVENPSGDALQVVTPSGRFQLSVDAWDDLDCRDGLEVRARIRHNTNLENGLALWTAGGGAETTENGIFANAWLSGGSSARNRGLSYTSGGTTVLFSEVISSVFNYQSWFNIRATYTGTASTDRYEQQISLESESSTQDVARPAARTTGWHGFGSASSGTCFCDWISLGTDGDPAPTGPLDVSAEPFRLRHNPRLNKVIPVLSSPTVTDIGATCVRPRVTKGY